MRAVSLVLLVLLVLATGCQTTRPPATSPASGPDAREIEAAEEEAAQSRGTARDVTIDGVSVLGAWYAMEVLDNRRATRDLQDGTMEQTLVVRPNGRAALTGIDRREGGAPVSFDGRIAGSRVTFAGMDGTGTLLMSGRRLVLRAPDGRSTVFVRSGR